MKKHVVFFLFTFLCARTIAQDEISNLQKYWHYRYRLVNYFMVVGEGPGMSLPADIRNHYNGNGLRWGETPVYLGHYIGVLATEYRLLKDNGQSTDRTLTELYYALKAVNRLDYVAEGQNPWFLTNDINGFLIRDDVPANFVSTHYLELNQNIIPGQGIIVGSGKPGEVTETASDFLGNQNSTTPENNAVSQDVIYHVLLGFALVKRCVDTGNLTFYNYVTNSYNNIDLCDMAIDEADKIVSYIKENHGDHWKINNPDGQGVVGHGADGFAYAIARAGNYITGIDYSDAYSDVLYYPTWQSLQNPSILLCDKLANEWSIHQMGMVLASISDSWKNILGNSTTANAIIENGDYDAGGFGLLPCEYFDNHFGWDVYYGMIWDLLYGGQTFIGDLCKAQQILNSAYWDGPFYHDPVDKAYPGWCATRRFFDDPPRQNNGKPAFEGNYNGLDYMLLFNLYYLDSRAQVTPFYVPQVSPYFVSSHYPYLGGNGITGDIADPAQIFSPNFPVIVNQLAVTTTGQYAGYLGNLTIYGGPQGVLLTNTTVENYASLLVYNTDINAACVPLQSYYFDISAYHYRLINPETPESDSPQLPPYIPTSEFALNKGENSLSIYPSPANENATLEYSLKENSPVSIYVQDMLGKNTFVILNQSLHEQGTYRVNLQTVGFPAGIYSCVMDCGNGASVVKKIIISH